jgi:hypothetical protein
MDRAAIQRLVGSLTRLLDPKDAAADRIREAIYGVITAGRHG